MRTRHLWYYGHDRCYENEWHLKTGDAHRVDVRRTPQLNGDCAATGSAAVVLMAVVPVVPVAVVPMAVVPVAVAVVPVQALSSRCCPRT